MPNSIVSTYDECQCDLHSNQQCPGSYSRRTSLRPRTNPCSRSWMYSHRQFVACGCLPEHICKPSSISRPPAGRNAVLIVYWPNISTQYPLDFVYPLLHSCCICNLLRFKLGPRAISGRGLFLIFCIFCSFLIRYSNVFYVIARNQLNVRYSMGD